MKTAHEILVDARNGIERDGWDVDTFGGPECGTPRCACGWVAFEAGARVDSPLMFYQPRGEYEKAMVALLHTAPVARREGFEGLFDGVEDIAFQLDREGLSAILAWFEAAISATAPPPEDWDPGPLHFEEKVA